MTDGRGLISGLPVGYPPNDTSLWTVNYNGIAQVHLVEPSGTGLGVGPFGMFGWLKAQETNISQCVINGGRGGAHTSQWLPGTEFYNSLVSRVNTALNETGTIAKRFLIYIGPNDALEASPNWIGNIQTTLAALRLLYGALPAIIVRLAVDPPIPAGTWTVVAAQIESIQDAQHRLVTPPSPPNLDGLHHSTEQNYVIAQRVLIASQ